MSGDTLRIMGRKPRVSQEQVLSAIQESFLAQGVPPTIDELRRRLRVGSTRTVLRYLQALEERGDIQRWAGARGLRLLRAPVGGMETREIPVVGQASAGPLMIAEENLEGSVRLPAAFLGSTGRFFLLRVRGDSMNRAVVGQEQIEDGDLVLVRQQVTAEPGNIVVALIDGEATIKRLEKAPGYWILQPDSTNPANRPIVVDDEFVVQGVVQKVLKKGAALVNA